MQMRNVAIHGIFRHDHSGIFRHVHLEQPSNFMVTSINGSVTTNREASVMLISSKKRKNGIAGSMPIVCMNTGIKLHSVL